MAAISRRAMLAALGGALAAGCAGTSASRPPQTPEAATAEGLLGEAASFESGRFQPWTDSAPAYRLFPGDVVQVTVHTAGELSGEYPVGPDGRVNLPLAGGVMVAGQTAPEAARTLASRYASVLRDPIIEVRAASFASQRILVGGEVANPGLFELPSARIGVLEAVLLAGGPTIRARRGSVVILRRAEDGGVMMREVDLSRALQGAGGADTIPVTRHDIVFVPRSGIAEVNDFIELYVRNIIPLDQAFAFALADSAFNN
jgi:protein involved in polysaccharide export with SLBB domain